MSNMVAGRLTCRGHLSNMIRMPPPYIANLDSDMFTTVKNGVSVLNAFD